MTIQPSDNLLPEMTPVVVFSPSSAPGISERPSHITGLGRILHIVNGEFYAGAERVQDLLAQCLPRFGFEIGFVCVKPREFSELRQSQDTPL